MCEECDGSCDLMYGGGEVITHEEIEKDLINN